MYGSTKSLLEGTKTYGSIKSFIQGKKTYGSTKSVLEIEATEDSCPIDSYQDQTSASLEQGYQNGYEYIQPNRKSTKMGCFIQIPQRWILAILMFMGLIANYMLRVNINMAIIEMTKNSSHVDISKKSTESASGNGFNWSVYDKGLILGAFYYSYFLMQVPGGRMAEISGTKIVFGLTMAGTALLAALTPLIAHLGVGPMVTVRVLQGCLEAPSFPILAAMITKWAPKEEHSSFMAFVMLGGTSGVIVTFPLCGMILQYWGWEAVFYVTASVTAGWLLLWTFLVHENPEDHPYMSQTELDLITSTRTYDLSRKAAEKKVNNIRLFWDAITCPAMLANMLMEFANTWGLIVLLTYGPTFMKDILNFNIQDNGLLSSLPWLCRFVFAQIIGYISGRLIKKKIVSPFKMQKLNSVLATLIPGIGMIWFSFTTEDKALCMFILSISFGINGACVVGHGLNNLTIAPNRAGTAYGLSNGCGNMAGFLAPLAISAILGEVEDPDEIMTRWKIVFGIPLMLYSLSLATFWIFGSGEVQEFDKKKYNIKEDESSES